LTTDRLDELNGFIDALNALAALPIAGAGTSVDPLRANITSVMVTAWDVPDADSQFFTGQRIAGGGEAPVNQSVAEMISLIDGRRNSHGTVGSVLNTADAWTRGSAALVVNRTELGRPTATNTPAIILDLTDAHADGWASMNAILNWSPVSMFVLNSNGSLYFPGLRATDAQGDTPNNAFGDFAQDGTDMSGNPWIAIPYTLERHSSGRLVAVYNRLDALNHPVRGGSIFYLPLHYRTGAEPGEERVIFAENSHVLPRTNWQVNIQATGNFVRFGGALTGHPIDAAVRNITLAERVAGNLVNATGVAINNQAFRIALPVDYAFSLNSTRDVRFEWFGVGYGANGGFLTAGGTSVFASPTDALAQMAGGIDGGISRAAGLTGANFIQAMQNTTEGQNARGAGVSRETWLNANIGTLNNTQISTIMRTTQHVAFITSPFDLGQRIELIIVLGTQAAAADAPRRAGVPVEFTITGIANTPNRLFVTHRDHLLPLFAEVRATISGYGVPSTEEHIATLVRSGVTLRPAPTNAAVPELIAGRLYGTAPNATLPTWSQIMTTRLPGGANHVNGQIVVDATGQDLLSASARVRLSEIVPMGAQGFTQYVFTLTDAEGNVLPDAKIAAVQVNSMAGGNTNANGINGIWQNRVSTQQPINITRHNGTAVWAATNDTAVTSPLVPGLSGRAMLEFSQDGHSVAIQNVALNNAALTSLAIDVRFWLSTAPDFTGTVYVTVSTPPSPFT
jgi:hypothetical protein